MLIRRYKEWFAIGFIVISSLLSGYFAYYVNPPRELIRDDGVKKWEERMIPIRKYLPASVHEVGYISDNESSAIYEEYSLTQFALAPVVVRHGVDFEWIIGNFTQRDFENILDQNISSNFTIQKIGAGIYLIRRTSP